MLSFGNSLLTCLAQKSKKQKGEKEPFSLAIFFLSVISLLLSYYLVACTMYVFSSLKATKVHYSFDAIQQNCMQFHLTYYIYHELHNDKKQVDISLDGKSIFTIISLYYISTIILERTFGAVCFRKLV